MEFDFSTLTNAQKKSFLCRFFRASHSAIGNKGTDFGQYLISSYDRLFVNIWIKNVGNYVLRSSGIKKRFVPKFYHNRVSINLLKNFVFVKRQVPKLLNYLSEQWTFGRVLYEYVKKIRFRVEILHWTLTATNSYFQTNGIKPKAIEFIDFHSLLKNCQVQ